MRNDNYWLRLRRRPLSRRRFLAGTGVAAAGSAAILAGCGDDDDDDDDDSGETPAATNTAAAGETPAATATAPSADSPRAGGTLRRWKGVEDAGLDPAVFHLNNAEVTHGVLNQVMTYQPTKNLFAADGMLSFEQIDDLTLVWNVRPGMSFHNGDPLGAEEWAFSANRLSPIYDARGGTHVTRPGFAFVNRWEAVDDLTVQEIWDRPNSDATIYRTRHYYSWVNPRIVESQGDEAGEIQDLPFGAAGGPYTLEQRDATGTLIRRWPGYYEHDPAEDGFVKEGPYIEEWHTAILPDRSAAKAAFLAGDLDVFGAVDELELAEFDGNERVTIAEVPAGASSLLGMDGGKFFDVRARQALQKAFDYEGFIASVRGGNGQYTGPVSPLLSGLNQLGQEDYKSWLTHDPAEARKLWEAAAPPVDVIRVLTSSAESLTADISDYTAQTLSASLGVPAEVEVLDSNSWAAKAIDRSKDTKDWELLMYGAGLAGGTTGIVGDSHLINYDPRGYGLNAFNFHTESPHQSIIDGSNELIAMLDAQEAELDPEARAGRITEIQTWILDNHWCNWNLPTASKSWYGFSSRLRDQGVADWLNQYGLRREAMWLADA